MVDQKTVSPIPQGDVELSIDRILARFPGPVTIRALTSAGAVKAGLIILGSLVVLALIMGGAYDIGVVVLFGCVGVAGWLLGLFASGKRLELDGVRFEVIAPFSYQSAVESVAVRDTYVARAGFKPLVHCLLNRKASDDAPNDIVVDYGFMDREVAGVSLSVEDLARLMTAWRDRVLACQAADNGRSGD